MPTVTCADLAPGQRVRFTPHDPRYKIIEGEFTELRHSTTGEQAAEILDASLTCFRATRCWETRGAFEILETTP